MFALEFVNKVALEIPRVYGAGSLHRVQLEKRPFEHAKPKILRKEQPDVMLETRPKP